MKTYFFIIKVVPSHNSRQADKVKGALAHFWVLDDSVENAVNRAEHYLSEYMWEIQGWEQEPVETTAAHFAQKKIGLKCYQKAQTQGLVAHFVGGPGTAEWMKEQLR